MTPFLTFRVFGNPVPQGSKIPGRSAKTGKMFVREQAGVRHKSWRHDVTTAAVEAVERDGVGKLEGPVVVTIVFYLKRPASVSEAKRKYPIVAPDVDKLTRLVLDSLTAANVFGDDAQVVGVGAKKLYATEGAAPGALITVSEII